MEFNVRNGQIQVDTIDITYLSTSSTLMVGDIQSVNLISGFETPPEKMIVGVTIPFIE